MEAPLGLGAYLLGTADAGVTAATWGRPFDFKGQCRSITFYIEGAGTISTGTLVLEEAPRNNYSGTWSQIGSDIDLTALSTGKAQAIHVDGCFRAVRARLSVAVTGSNGAVTVQVVGN